MMPIKCEKLAVSRVSAPPRCFKTQKGPVKIGAIRIHIRDGSCPADGSPILYYGAHRNSRCGQWWYCDNRACGMRGEFFLAFHYHFHKL